MPATTTTAPGSVAVTQPMITYGPPTYYYYPQRPFFGLFRRNMAQSYYYTPTYSYAPSATATYSTQPPTYYVPQTYSYAPVRRMWPFNMFQRRYSAYPATVYSSAGYYTTPGYTTMSYGQPTYYYTPGTTAVSSGTTAPSGASARTYVPTTYTAPLPAAPPGGAPPAPVR